MPLTPPPGLESRSFTAENPTGARGAGGRAGAGRKGSPSLSPFRAGQTVTLAEIGGPGCIRHLWMTTPPGNPLHDRNLILRAYWDEQATPSIECPLGDFFGIAHGRRMPLASALVSMPEGRGLNTTFPMPFRRSARLTLENDSGADVEHLFYQVDATLGDVLPPDTASLHVQFRRQNPTVLRQDYLLLDGVEGKGRFLGCVLGIRTGDDFWWGEGEVKFYLDGDREFPTLCGTGLEDYFGSAWGIGEHQTPLHGCPLYLKDGNSDRNALVSLYRWHVPDPIYFHQNLRVAVQQIGGAFVSQIAGRLAANDIELVTPLATGQTFTLFERQDDVCSAAFWYQTLPTAPFPTLPDRSLRSVGLAPL